jgi:3-oxoacyl-[acyl-carrier-protein] synthase III
MGSERPGSQILGTGAYAPEKVLTNHELARMVDTSDEWIRERTGIRERRIARDDETASDMAYQASCRALEAAGLTARDLDMIIVGTVTGDLPMPACAAILQRKLGVRTIPAFDISAACAGFIYGLSIGDQFIRTGTLKRILVVGVELLSRVLNWRDRVTCVLFGDGAGAAVLGPAGDDGRGVLSTRLYTDSALVDSLCIPAGGSREPLTPEGLARHRDKVFMVGSDIFKIAVKNLTSASRAALDAGGLRAADVKWVVPHQANLRIIAQVALRLDIPLERFVLNIERYGNTSSASIPLALDEAVRDGRISKGDTVLMCALGAGISWGSALVRV